MEVQAAGDNTHVFFGRLTNPQRVPGNGTTDLVIDDVLTRRAAFGRGDTLQVAACLPIPNPKNPPRALFFAEVTGGVPEVYRVVSGTKALGDYVKGVLAAAPQGRAAVLRFCSDYLGHEDKEIAGDAHKEFLLAPEADVRQVARQLRPGQLRRWIQDKGTEDVRLGLYAYLLGNCGEAKDIALLRGLLTTMVRRKSSSAAQVFVGYTLLEPKAGFATILGLARDAKTDFLVRYSVLHALHTLRTSHPGLLKESDFQEVFRHLLEQDDLADVAIEDLRRWRCWRLTDQILALYDNKAFDIPSIRRSILRYALSCPDPQGMRLVDRVRKSNPSQLADAEAPLRLEAAIAVGVAPR